MKVLDDSLSHAGTAGVRWNGGCYCLYAGMAEMYYNCRNHVKKVDKKRKIVKLRVNYA
jgi:hypothetical protein